MFPGQTRSHPPVLDLGQKSIRVQLALLVLGIVLPAFVVAVSYLLHQRDVARELASEKVALLAFNTAQRLASRMREHELMMGYVAAQPFVQAMDPARCERSIQDLASINPEYLGIGTRDLRGTAICTYRRGGAQCPADDGVRLVHPQPGKQPVSGQRRVSGADRAALDQHADHAGARRH